MSVLGLYRSYTADFIKIQKAKGSNIYLRLQTRDTVNFAFIFPAVNESKWSLTLKHKFQCDHQACMFLLLMRLKKTYYYTHFDSF